MPARVTPMFALLALLALPLTASAQLANLHVLVTQLEPATGKVEVSLFDNAEDFMKKPFLQQTLPVDGNSELQFEFAGLVDGAYGVVVVHDENDNGVYDAGFLGFGGEGLGYSNDARPWLGRPSFEAVRVDVGTEDLEIVIRTD
ncbi:DUF2141 domain-containing protein [Elongatibacter sediminis]|uniref:DUF2141 domain-containing protein n=1 Tax=Elongatibacter sediminis TaxID=3119006 RepID=A0AAW9RD75_9GAMM